MLNERYFGPLLSYSRDPRLERAADLFVKAAAVFAFLLMARAYFALLLLPIYGHDEAHYHQFYRFTLIDDGRWLNFLLHGFMRSVPLPLWALLYISMWWTLLYRLARGCNFGMPLAALVASVTLVAPPYLEIGLWPATVVPALTIAFLALWMQTRGYAYPAIYVVAGILMFGAIQTVYFILPLLFLQQFLDTSQPMRARGLLLAKHLAWWVLGAIAGVLVMSLMLLLLEGIYFPQPAPWRNAQPAEDASGLMANVDFVITNFITLFKLLLLKGGVLYGFVAICAVIALLRLRTLLAQTPAFVLLGAVLISFFVFCIPLAPAIHMRSLLAMAAVVVLGLALLPGATAPGRVVAALLLLKLAYNHATLAHDFLAAHRTETAVYMRKLQELIPGYPNYSALAVYGTMDPARPEARRFNDSSLIHPMLVALGVPAVLDCRTAGPCERVGAGGEIISVVPFAGGQLELTVDPANIGIIRYTE